MPPPCGFSTSVGTSTSFVVTRIVGDATLTPGIGFGGSIGGNCCACANAANNKPPETTSFINRSIRNLSSA